MSALTQRETTVFCTESIASYSSIQPALTTSLLGCREKGFTPRILVPRNCECPCRQPKITETGAMHSFESSPGLDQAAQRRNHRVDIFIIIVEGKRWTHGAFHTKAPQCGLRAVMTRSNGDTFPVQCSPDFFRFEAVQ